MAIEMESAGASQAGHLNRALPVLAVRGISDKADGAKHLADGEGWQPVAASHATAFALAVADMVLATDSGDRDHDRATLPADDQLERGRAVPSDRSFSWRALPVPIEPIWRDALTSTISYERTVLQLHLLTDGANDRLEMGRLAPLADSLVTLGRAHTLFTAGEQVDVHTTDRAAWVLCTDPNTGPTGAAVHRSGQRSAWKPLPHDMLGAVLDSGDLVDRMTVLLRFLIAVGLTPTERVAPAVALAPVGMLAEGRVSDIPRSRSTPTMRRTPLRVPAEDTLLYEDVVQRTRDVAEELAARLLAVFHSNR